LAPLTGSAYSVCIWDHEKPYKAWAKMKKLCVIAGAIILLIAAGFIFYNNKTADDTDGFIDSKGNGY
jgi:hypothetical protein